MYVTKFKEKYLPEFQKFLKDADAEWTVVCDMNELYVLMYNSVNGLFYNAYKNKIVPYYIQPSITDAVFVEGKNKTCQDVFLSGKWKIVGTSGPFVLVKNLMATTTKKLFPSRLKYVGGDDFNF